MPPNQDKTSSGKKVDKIFAHNRFVFYSCNRELRIDLAHDATVGDRNRNLKKNSTFHQDQSMESTSNERRVHLHTLVDRERKRSRERG